MTPPDTKTDDIPEQDTGETTEPTGDEGGQDEQQSLSLEVKVSEPSACERHVIVTISREDVDRYLDKSYSELMPKAEVPGFRPGRAPRKLVESRFRDQIVDQVKGSLLMDSMAQVNKENDFSAISEPDFDFDVVQLPEEGPMTFEFDIEVRPDFDLPKWKGLKIEKPVRKFTKKDVTSHMKNLLSRFAEEETHTDGAEADDLVTVTIKFKHGGKTVSQVEEQEVRVRKKLSFADGTLEKFDKLMEGAKKGDKKTGEIKLSADSPNEALRGEKVDCELEVLEVKRLKLPKIDDEFLQQVGGFESEEALRDAVEQEMERQLSYHQQRQVRQQITESLIESADWELPPDLLRRQSGRELERAVMELQSAGFNSEAIQAHENELRQNSAASTSRALKEHFILERIAEEESLEVDADDFDSEIELIAMQQNQSPRRVRARLEKQGAMDSLSNQIIERKVIDLITAEADFKETKYKPESEDTAAVNHTIGGEEAEIPEAKPGGQAEALREPTDHT